MYPDNSHTILTATTGKSASPEAVDQKAATTGLESAKKRRKTTYFKKETLAIEKGASPSHPLTKLDKREDMNVYKSFVGIISL